LRIDVLVKLDRRLQIQESRQHSHRSLLLCQDIGNGVQRSVENDSNAPRKKFGCRGAS
jgi:hypothetical protein